MWPHERHQHYRLPGAAEAHEHHLNQQQHGMQLLASSSMCESTGLLVSSHAREQHQERMQRGQFCQQPMAPPGPSNPRASRNMAEKQRRDNLNTNISNMAALVPTVAGSPRRLDKISILRLAATYLRTKYALGTGQESFLPRKFDKFDLEKFLFETLVQNDGFMLVVTSTGKIVYVGRQVEQYLGHAQADLLGQSIYNYVIPEDHDELARNLTPSESTNRLMLTESQGEDSIESEDSRPIGGNEMPFGDERRSFDLRMSQRAASRREHTQYEWLHISGLLRPAEACRSAGKNQKGLYETNATSNDIIFVGIARMRKRRITELSLLEANKEEYVTRHLVDGRIIFCDHRISVVAGYMTHEVSGMSAFKYMHAEDVLWTIVALRQMYDRGEGFGSSCYRLKTKTGEYIYLRTHAYIEVDQDRRLFQSFICVNTSVPKEEGEKLVNEMKSRYSATMNSQCNSLQPVTPKVAVKDPLQLDDAINSLISDIALRPVSDDGLSNVSSNVPDVQSMKAVCVSQHLPPASIHANEIGIKCIERPLPSNGKDKSIKRENSVSSPGSTHSGGQGDNSRDIDEPRNQGRCNVSNMNARCLPEKVMPENLNTEEPKLFHSQSTASNLRYGKRDEDYYKSEASSSCSSSMLTEDCSLSNNRELIKPPCATATVQPSSRGKPESMFAHVKMEKLDYGNVDTIQRSKSCAIKRPNINETPISSTKKRRGNKNVGTCGTKITTNLDQNDSSIGHYEPNNQFPPFAAYKDDQMLEKSPIICKSERTTENGNEVNARFETDSPCPSLHDLPIDYQPLNTSNVDLTVYGDDFPDLQSDSFLSSELNDNPENIDDRTIQQFPTSDQAVSEGLKKTHMELENRMTLQTNELTVLEHKLQTPGFQSEFFKPRETLIELRAEHTKNTRMLQTIQQDHMNNMQTNSMKQNIGV
ncbi:hypoxia-inducible factor 1-alpha-like isoform X2 [Venturia canescens]|uniref:hypoxia-inducible factor 1-alpha-like isoform X2 n=1 Tax=Venturia canescens TaxID=32260 RepID=UPI001C9D64A2|nr:hypoxia-inducible factor 1-alpha-like isoform X2 [Venturia canescens]